ncbi:MAG: hypothetical protein P4L42_07345 [Desulfocapsaceae bacterium]|nr:hypothetical protein [Desulfocapsaceae bacterium]
MSDGSRNKGPASEDRKRSIAMAHLADLDEGVPATPEERGFAACPCPGNCTLHGQCLLCTAFHGRKGRLPMCMKNISLPPD